MQASGTVNAYPFEPASDAPNEASPAATSLDILVVDDEWSSREGLANVVRALGHTCRMAADGKEALRAIADKRPDVVISDWEMPDMNGAELCRQTRGADADVSYTYLILLSAYGDREHLLAGMAAGADDYQTKPVDLDDLEAHLVSAARVVDLQRRLMSRTAEPRTETERFYRDPRTDALTGTGELARQAQATPRRPSEQPGAVPLEVERYFWPIYRVRSNGGGWDVLDRTGQLMERWETPGEALDRARELARGDGAAHLVLYGDGGRLQTEFVARTEFVEDGTAG